MKKEGFTVLYFEILDQHPSDKVALIFRNNQVTYGQLKTKVEAWANSLQTKGVKKGDKVGLFSRNCSDFVVAYLAIIRAGGVVVPFNFQLAPREVVFIVKDAGMKVLVTKELLPLEEALKEEGLAGQVKQYTFTDMEIPVEHNFTNYPMTENDNCTIIYTSGTTGKPKGAMLSHKNLLANTRGYTQMLHTNAHDIALCVLPMYHCFAWTVSISGNLLFGATIVIQETYIFKDTMKLIAAYKINNFVGVPTMMQLFVKGATKEELANIKYFVSGGAPLPKRLGEEFQAKFGLPVQEGYGLSEASPVVTVNPDDRIKLGSIGLPLPNVEVKILSEEGQEMPVDEVGELCARGDNVMLGYLNQPEATKHALRGGWLHTEDLAYKDEEGYLFIVDRLKDMIISSGENVYPREIEEALYTHPAIAEAAVVGIPDKLRGQAICAYIVLKDGQQLDNRTIRKYLLGRIAPYKVPREFFYCEQLPKNSTGKILKRVLQEQAVVDMVHRKR
jgi:long-chain acyl-CoA synthetase